MNIYTIGFAQKSAKTFFELLYSNEVDCLLDVRLNNSSQLSGFTKGRDLEYFLEKILSIKYYHNLNFAPTKEILKAYKKKNITWEKYEQLYLKLISNRKVENLFEKIISNKFQNICLLCSEPKPQQCHRRLLANYLQQFLEDICVIHL